MNDRKFEKKISRDIDRAKEDLATLGNDSVAGLSRMVEQRVDDARKTATDTVETVNRKVEQQLSQYNANVQSAADRLPGGLGKKAVRYPWVTITMSLALGLLFGGLIRSGWQSMR